MDNAAWTKIAVTITPDNIANPSPPGDGSATADLCAFSGANRTLSQTTTIPATTGPGTSTDFTPAVTFNREFHTAAIDGVNYVVSVYVQDQGALGNTLRLSIQVVGGFIQARVVSSGGSVSAHIWGWQLELGTVPSAYIPRTT